MITQIKEQQVLTNLFPKKIQMYSRKEVAELFHTSEDTISALVCTGCLEAIKIGKSYSFSYYSILDFENEYRGFDLSSTEKMKNAYEIKHKEAVACRDYN